MQSDDIRMMADAIWEYILKRYLKDYLSDSVCYYRAVVTSAPANNLIGVQRPYDETVYLPYMWSAGNLTVGDQCTVLVFGDPSNAVVMGDGALKTPDIESDLYVTKAGLATTTGTATDNTMTQKAITEAINAGGYVLPEATASMLGGVTIGANINVSGGKISVNNGSTSVKGVVQLASSVTSGGANPPTAGAVFDLANGKADKQQGLWYCTCTTTNRTSTKEICPIDPVNFPDGDANAMDGICIRVLFAEGNTNTTANDMTLQLKNVSNFTEAQPVRFLGFPDTYIPTWSAGTVIDFIWDNSEYESWIAVSYPRRATSSYYGVTKLNNTVTSSSLTEAATANAVRIAYAAAQAAQEAANEAQDMAEPFVAIYNTTSFADVKAAWDANRRILVRVSTDGSVSPLTFYYPNSNDPVFYFDSFGSDSYGSDVTTYELRSTGWTTTTAGIQNKLTFDATPTSGSANPVTSGGIYQAIQNVSGGVFVATYGTTTSAELAVALSAGKAIYVKTNVISGDGATSYIPMCLGDATFDYYVFTSIEEDRTMYVITCDGGTWKNTNMMLAPKNSPFFTGTPTAPTAASGTNTTQIATTAFVQAAVAGSSGGGGGILYGVCDTAAATQQKDVTISGVTALTAGLSIRVKFTNAQTYNGQPTLNLNSLGATGIVRQGTTAEVRYAWLAGEVVDFVYDGANWVSVNGGIATTTYYGVTKLTSSTTSTSTSLAASAAGLKAVNDRMTYGATDLTAGTSALATGVFYAYYE